MQGELESLFGGKSEGGDVTILQKGLRVNKNACDSLDALVKARNLTRADIVRLAINEYVKNHKE